MFAIVTRNTHSHIYEFCEGQRVVVDKNKYMGRESGFKLRVLDFSLLIISDDEDEKALRHGFYCLGRSAYVGKLFVGENRIRFIVKSIVDRGARQRPRPSQVWGRLFAATAVV